MITTIKGATRLKYDALRPPPNLIKPAPINIPKLDTGVIMRASSTNSIVLFQAASDGAMKLEDLTAETDAVVMFFGFSVQLVLFALLEVLSVDRFDNLSTTSSKARLRQKSMAKSISKACGKTALSVLRQKPIGQPKL